MATIGVRCAQRAWLLIAHLLMCYSSGQLQTLEMMEADIDKGPHSSALNPKASQQLQAELAAKVKIG